MKIEECIFYQLSKASQAAGRFLGDKVAPFGVTTVQAVVLNFLSDGDKITSNALGRRTKLDSATLTGILDRLAAMGLIERRPNPADRRAILVYLTPDGKKAAKAVHQTILKANSELLHRFAGREREALRAMLKRIHQD